MKAFRLIFLSLLAACLCAQIPSTYSDLYGTLQQDLSDWQSKIDLLCAGCAPYPWFGVGQLFSANSNNGPGMVLTAKYMTAVDEEILMHKAMGVRAIAVEVSFPMLYPGFFPAQGTTYNQWAGFYSTVAQHIRNQGLKVIVESQTMMRTGIGSSWATSVAAFYAGFTTFRAYTAARATAAANVAAWMNPDYFIVQEEPDTEANQTGQPVDEVANAVRMLDETTAAVRGAPGFTGKVGAGVGSWFQQYDAFTKAFTQQACGTCVASKLDFLDIHLFPVNENGSCSGCPNACVPCGNPDFARTNAMSIVATATTATNHLGQPMQMTMSQGWLRKVRDTEWPSSTLLYGSYRSGDIQEARDAYAFWETDQAGNLLDQAWLKAVESLANYAHFLWLCPFNTQNWSSYTAWSAATAINDEGVTNPDNTPSRIYATEAGKAGAAMDNALYTPMAQNWHDSLVPKDVTAPSAPVGLTATPNASTSIWLSWTASTDNVGVAGYQIWRDGAQVGVIFAPPFNDTGLTPKTTYGYQVYAFDLANNISEAASLSVTMPKDSTPPTAPEGLKANATSPSQVKLSWQPSTDPDSPVQGYYVYRDGTSVGTAETSSYLDSGLVGATTYKYTVAAFDPSKNVSAQSKPALATTLVDTTPPTVPAGLAAVAISATQMDLSWVASSDPDSPVAGYNIYQNGSKIGTSAETNFQSTGLSPSTTYSYTVSAADPSGNTSAQSSPVSGTTLRDTTPPSTPTGVAASVISTTQINLSWTPSTDPDSAVAGYNIYQNGTQVGTSATSRYQATGLYAGVSYTYRISAYDAANNISLDSAPVTASTLPDTTPPTVPTGLSAVVVSATQVNLSWRTSTDPDSPVAGYFVYRNGTTIAAPSATSYQDSGLVAGRTYSYTVAAFDPSLNASAQSNAVSVTIQDTTAPTVPGALRAVAVSSSQINLTWTASTDPDSPVATYSIYRNGYLVGVSPTPSFQSTGLTANTSYSYTVSASDPSGNTSAQSSAVSATTLR